MTSFIVDESHLRQLSPEARRELLQILSAEVAALRIAMAEETWDAEGNQSYPLTAEEARVFVRGLPEPAKRMLRIFCRNFDGETGHADLEALITIPGLSSYDELGHEVSAITQRLRNVTGNADAWLFNWRARDWVWDEASTTYTQGRYFISMPAIASLRDAFSIG